MDKVVFQITEEGKIFYTHGLNTLDVLVDVIDQNGYYTVADVYVIDENTISVEPGYAAWWGWWAYDIRGGRVVVAG